MRKLVVLQVSEAGTCSSVVFIRNLVVYSGTSKLTLTDVYWIPVAYAMRLWKFREGWYFPIRTPKSPASAPQPYTFPFW